jgi:GTPase SAR1 family protein
VFIVDSTDIKRLPEAKEELTKLLTSEDLSKLPFLILGNKIDAKGAMSEAQLKSALGLQNTSGKVLGKVPEGVQPLELFMCRYISREMCVYYCFHWFSLLIFVSACVALSVYKRAGYPDGFRWLSENLK